jgi:hypothetical protein
MQQCGINDFFTDSIFGKAAQLLKEGVECELVYGQDQLCGRLFSAAVSCSHMNFMSWSTTFRMTPFFSKTGSTW